jgi:hypothetical protein
MLSYPLEQISETEIAYWRGRVASLEILICELLAKNQHMRFVLEPTTQNRPVNSVLTQR